MKRQYIKSDEHLKRKRESAKFTEADVARNRYQSAPNGDTMARVFSRIMKDPDVTLGKRTRRGYRTVFFKGKDIGWINERGVGWIDDDAYDLLVENEDSEHPWISSLLDTIDLQADSENDD